MLHSTKRSPNSPRASASFRKTRRNWAAGASSENETASSSVPIIEVHLYILLSLPLSYTDACIYICRLPLENVSCRRTCEEEKEDYRSRVPLGNSVISEGKREGARKDADCTLGGKKSSRKALGDEKRHRVAAGPRSRGKKRPEFVRLLSPLIRHSARCNNFPGSSLRKFAARVELYTLRRARAQVEKKERERACGPSEARTNALLALSFSLSVPCMHNISCFLQRRACRNFQLGKHGILILIFVFSFFLFLFSWVLVWLNISGREAMALIQP